MRNKISSYLQSVEALEDLLATPEAPWSAVVEASKQADFLLGTLSPKEVARVAKASH